MNSPSETHQPEACQPVHLDRWEPWQLCGRSVRFRISRGVATPQVRLGFFFASGLKESATVMIFCQEGPETQCIPLRQEDVNHIEKASESGGAEFACLG